MLDTIHLRRDSVIIFGLDWAIIKLQDYLDQKYKRLIEVGTYLFYIITITLLRRLANFISIIVYRFEWTGYSLIWIFWAFYQMNSRVVWFRKVYGSTRSAHVKTCVYLIMCLLDQSSKCVDQKDGANSEAVVWRCNFIKKECLAQVFSCKFCKIFKKTFFCRTPLVAASAILHIRENFFNILQTRKVIMVNQALQLRKGMAK